MNKGKNFLRTVEAMIEKWWRAIPHLPITVQRWLAENIWWIALIGTIVTAMSVLALLNTIRQLTNPVGYYGYALTSAYSGWQILTSIIALFFLVISGLLMGFAVKPLRVNEKKGWMLLFLVGLVEAVNIAVGAVLSLSVFGFIIQILFGAIGIAVGMYFLFEIRDHFAHIVVSKPSKPSKK